MLKIPEKNKNQVDCFLCGKKFIEDQFILWKRENTALCEVEEKICHKCSSGKEISKIHKKLNKIKEKDGK